jgi:hypothetical protein
MSKLPHFLDNCLTDGSEVVSLLTPERFLVHISVGDYVDPSTCADEQINTTAKLMTYNFITDQYVTA